MDQQLQIIYPDTTYQPTSVQVKGYDFSQGPSLDKVLASFGSVGLQASHFAKAREIIDQVLSLRNRQQKCVIFLGYTSNMVSSGLRQTIRFLAQNSLIDCIVTTTGGIQQDLMKCLGTFHMGQFNMDDIQNRQRALHRIGNILVPSKNYIALQKFLMPVYEQLYLQQKKQGKIHSPRSIIDRLGKRIDNKQSIYYWCHKNKIPVHCPSLTDGALGDMLFSFSYKHQGFIVDIAQDIAQINKQAMYAHSTFALVLGGGLVKHHILNANIWRNGAQFAVFINTGLYEDGSDSGAKLSEAYTWGKLKPGGKSVKIFSEASLVFPLLINQTFCKWLHKQKKVE